MITAIILINTAQGQVPEVAQALLKLPGITEAYSVAGPYDLVAIARVRVHEELDGPDHVVGPHRLAHGRPADSGGTRFIAKVGRIALFATHLSVPSRLP